MVRQTVALVLTVALLNAGCASTAGGPRVQAPATPVMADRTRTLMTDYVTRIAIGSKVRVDLADGRRLHGTLMTAGSEGIVIQPRARIPEAPVEIRLDQVAVLELEEHTTNIAKTVAIAAGASVASVLAVFAILAAVWSD